MKAKEILFIILLMFWMFSCKSLLNNIGGLYGNLDQEKEDYKIIEQILAQYKDSEINEYKVFLSPTYPEKEIYVLPEWESTEYFVLAIPYSDGFSNEKITKYFMDIIESAIEYTNVLVLINEDELGALNQLMLNLKELGLYKKIYQSKNQSKNYQIKILSTRFNTKWIRDYGPIFGKAKNNNFL